MAKGKKQKELKKDVTVIPVDEKVEILVAEIDAKEDTLLVDEVEYVQLGSKVSGKFHKSESYSLIDFIDILMDSIDVDIIQALKSYGKDTNLKANLKAIVSKQIALDAPGKSL